MRVIVQRVRKHDPLRWQVVLVETHDDGLVVARTRWRVDADLIADAFRRLYPEDSRRDLLHS